MLKLAFAQINTTVGDIAGNRDRIADYLTRARDAGADLVLFPELAICGYPPEDLLLREDFLADCQHALLELAAGTGTEVALIGFPQIDGRDLYNALAVCSGGIVQAVYRKMHLPNYGVFDESRYFRAGDQPAMIRIAEHQIGLTICEDVWLPGAPLMAEAMAGADLVVNLSASPYERGKGQVREQMLAQRARDNLAAIAYCNLVGGQDELIFDGQSLLIDHRGRTVMRAAQFTEQLTLVDLDLSRTSSARLHDPRYRTLGQQSVPVLAEFTQQAATGVTPRDGRLTRPGPQRLPVAGRALEPRPAASGAQVLERTDHVSGLDHVDVAAAVLTEPLDSIAEVYEALKLGVADYARKSGFERVLLGLSGGVDSALVALIAADALGPQNVTCVVMPSVYSSAATQSDARDMGRRLGVDLREIPIKPMMDSYEQALADDFAGRDPDVTEENLQARIRGNLLMAMSNKFGWLLLTTGNKSEMSVGYATLYGDMAGGFGVLKDVPKLLVFELCRWRNRQAQMAGEQVPVPWSIIDRPPSAELRDDQRDDQALPPYEVLDPILERFIEEDESIDQIVAAGFDLATVERVVRLVNVAEYKRRQAPPGVKITRRAFGRDRRMPIVNRYRPLGQRAQGNGHR